MSYPQNILVTVDAVLFTEDHREVLLIQRKNDPFKEQWALPGDRKSTRLNSSHSQQSRMPSSA